MDPGPTIDFSQLGAIMEMPLERIAPGIKPSASDSGNESPEYLCLDDASGGETPSWSQASPQSYTDTAPVAFPMGFSSSLEKINPLYDSTEVLNVNLDSLVSQVEQQDRAHQQQMQQLQQQHFQLQPQQMMSMVLPTSADVDVDTEMDTGPEQQQTKKRRTSKKRKAGDDKDTGAGAAASTKKSTKQSRGTKIKPEPNTDFSPAPTPAPASAPAPMAVGDGELTEQSSAPGLLDPDTIRELPANLPVGWTAHEQRLWPAIYNGGRREVVDLQVSVEIDKGFTYSPLDDAFVCQKKNHFQLSVHVKCPNKPAFVLSPQHGLVPIVELRTNVFGVKVECPEERVPIEQSQSDRSKLPFTPVKIKLTGDEASVTMSRLHFSETTSNNIRKKGKPNPDQRYFVLVVCLEAICQNVAEPFQILALRSQRMIVRASNPSQFDHEKEARWIPARKGPPGAISYHANVGIQNDKPTEALTVGGNIRLSGAVMTTSDQRVKENIQPTDTREQLRNIRSIPLYNYQLREEWANVAGRAESRAETGVLAQELSEVLPSAVSSAGKVVLANGEVIDDLRIVNKERLFMESVGAIQELCKTTDHLETRIRELESLNEAMRREAKTGSLKSLNSRKGLARRLRSHKYEPFPYCRLLGWLGIVLLICSLLAVGVVLLVDRTGESDGSADSQKSSDVTTPLPTFDPSTTTPFVITPGNGTGTTIDNATSDRIQMAKVETDRCSDCNLAYETCIDGNCTCRFGASLLDSTQCVQSDPAAPCFGDCRESAGIGYCAAGTNDTLASCVCASGWMGPSCEIVDSDMNNFLSSLTVTSSNPEVSIHALRPFVYDRDEFVFNITAPPSSSQVSVLLNAKKFNPTADWTVSKYLYMECLQDGAVHDLLPSSDPIPFSDVHLLVLGNSGLYYIALEIQADDSIIQHYNIVVQRNCDLVPV